MANVVNCKTVLPAVANSSKTASDGAPLTPGGSRSLSDRRVSLSSLRQPRCGSACLQSPPHSHRNRVAAAQGKKLVVMQPSNHVLSSCWWHISRCKLQNIMESFSLYILPSSMAVLLCHHSCLSARYDDDDVGVQNLSFFERLVKAWRILFPEKARKLR